MYDPQVHVHKAVLMQRLLDAVVRGYEWHVYGIISLQKAEPLVEKFAERYGIDLNANQRAYRKRLGRANARLFLYTSPECTDMYWWLLATPGTGKVREEERLMHAIKDRQRIQIGNDYELVRRTRSRAHGGGMVWTWKMTRTCYTRWRERIILSCRRFDPGAVKQAVASLYRVPGFSGNRQQVGKLVALMRTEWRRRHGNLESLILPLKLPYVERLHDTAVRLSQIRNVKI